MPDKYRRTRLAFYFLCEKEATSQRFSLDELEQKTNWKKKTVSSYLSKRWKNLVTNPAENAYECKGICKMSLNDFINLQKQTI